MYYIIVVRKLNSGEKERTLLYQLTILYSYIVCQCTVTHNLPLVESTSNTTLSELNHLLLWDLEVSLLLAILVALIIHQLAEAQTRHLKAIKTTLKD
jgi:hypothetical protein